MTFQKLDEHTVRCILSEEDMNEHGLRIEDFFTNKDKARSFLEDVVKQAHDEVGYETNGDTLAMQVMPLPKNGLAITFSERSEHALQSMLGHIRSAIEGIQNQELDEMLEQVMDEENIDDYDKKKVSKKAGKKEKKTFFKVYQFETLEEVEGFCQTVPETMNVKSQLYKDKKSGMFYLTIEKGRIAIKNLEKICFCAEDFASLVSEQEAYLEYCKEHFKCMIKKGAVKVMRSLAIMN